MQFVIAAKEREYEVRNIYCSLKLEVNKCCIITYNAHYSIYSINVASAALFFIHFLNNYDSSRVIRNN